MCGIAGFVIKSDTLSFEKWPAVLKQMGNAIRFRGPDDSGVWADERAGVGLSHRRLSILDLSKAGHQPMMSLNRRYVMVFNGEIYNHLDLRQELDSRIKWRGLSDTETLLEALAAWGVEKALRRAVGMFALALWDRSNRILTLARDRIGEKPLYYGWSGKDFLFGSQLKALSAYPLFAAEIDRNVLPLLLRYNYIPAPHSIYRGVKKLPPASLVALDAKTCKANEWPEPKLYWSFKNIAQQGQKDLLQCSEQEAAEALDGLLRKAVSRQMVADVPLGAFLSGGIDSSTIVAIMQAQSCRPVKTFTIGFNDPSHNEANHARAVAGHLGTDHNDLYVTAQQALEVIPTLPLVFDEPFSDHSQIPTLLLSQLARDQVGVSLSGDAGDELFGGYSNYRSANRNWKAVGRLPAALRSQLARWIAGIPQPLWEAIPGSRDKACLAGLVGCPTRELYYNYQISHWKSPELITIGGREPETVPTDPRRWAKIESFQHHMMFVDLNSYLPDCILVKIDRAAMAVSLETRIPLLDHNVVEFAWRLPVSMKLGRHGQGKYLLRQVLYRYIPRSLVDRPKKGFGIPLDSWLRGPLRQWAEELLGEGRLARECFLRPAPIRKIWQDHLLGKHNWGSCLWDVLMFQQWLEHTKTLPLGSASGLQ
ncbi:MAG: asparagine synthase (glutamine-hydrolyzing) [Syntrophobacteraceae bacterium]